MKQIFLAVALLTSGLVLQAQDLRPDNNPNSKERVTIAEFGDRTEYTKFYESGQIKERGYYHNGERHGIFVFYHESGTVLIKGQYFHDKKVGTWLTTSADQSKKYELVYGPNGRVITQLWAAQ
jgi:antitoxin component YwqK of YwqJK toxin-antitoxin module